MYDLFADITEIISLQNEQNRMALAVFLGQLDPFWICFCNMLEKGQFDQKFQVAC